MDLVWSPDMLNLYDEGWRIWSHQENCAPVRFLSADNEKHAIVTDSIVGNGTTIQGAYVRRSVLSNHTQVATGAQMIECVVLPRCEIGEGARLHRSKRMHRPLPTSLGRRIASSQLRSTPQF